MTKKLDPSPFFSTKLLSIEVLPPLKASFCPIFADTVSLQPLPALRVLKKSVIMRLRNIKRSKTTYKTVKRFSAKRNR